MSTQPLRDLGPVDLVRVLIKQDRLAKGMSPEQYGIRVGVSGMTIRRVEKGYWPFLSTQYKLADALGMTREALFGPTGEYPEMIA